MKPRSASSQPGSRKRAGLWKSKRHALAVRFQDKVRALEAERRAFAVQLEEKGLGEALGGLSMREVRSGKL